MSDNKDRELQDERTQSQGLEQNNNDQQNVSGTEGGTAGLDQGLIDTANSGAGRNTHGSGMRSKRTLTGGDFDGQIADQ